MGSEKDEFEMLKKHVDSLTTQITDLKEVVEELKLEVRNVASMLTKNMSLSKNGAINRTGEGISRLDSIDLLNLPKHLQETYQALLKIGKKSMADEVATETCRQRPLESDYLNQLSRMKLVRKDRQGKKVYFSLDL